ncbi:tellurite resistance TerB family protein [Hyphomicrobium sp.]|uniref:tellurite resistance TerB family protein n=1 Tax=Hyphomicrobium sp. TaxID=82 RepID=UPI0025BDC74C|nr:tellurite resistance TerB family protein [Hyphomicrobium sp.]MCC7250831.1 tellurite resistance TerB family protein [Hyphomicrobium sp.]
MIDATKLLDLVMGAGAQPQGTGSVPVTHRGPDRGAADAGAQPADLLEQAKSFLGSRGGSFAGGAAVGTLATLLLGTKGGREIAGDALKLGAAAALGGLAYKAYTDYKQGKPVLGTRAAEFLSAAQAGATLPGAPAPNEHALLLLRAMIAAALSDGLIDAEERQRIAGRLADAGVGAEERQFLEREIATPWSPQQFTAAASTPEVRSEVYLASAIAIEADTPAEQAYLRYLAATLGLEEGLVAHLDQAVASAKAPAATSVPQSRTAGA